MTATRSLLVGLTLLALPHWSAFAGNPFLTHPDEQPVSAEFRGTEWGDEIQAEDLPLRARVVTQRLKTTPWSAIFRISFVDMISLAPEPREVKPLYFIVTDEKIYLLNETDIDEAIARLGAMEKTPEFDPAYVRGIVAGKLSRQDGPWETKVTVKGDICEYSSTHNSGHFARMTWKKGVGLIGYANGSGARQDGYSLKRVDRQPKKKP